MNIVNIARDVRPGVRRVGVRLLAALALVALPALAADLPDSVVRAASAELLEVIRTSDELAASDPDAFYREVATRLEKSVDFDGIARLVMATHYRKANDAQRKRFAEAFKWGLVRTYAKALMDFDNVQLNVLGSTPGRRPTQATVRMEATSDDGRSYPMEYSMVQTDDGWRMRNLVINGINLGLTYRNQFAAAMRAPENRGDIDRVIDGWSAVIDTSDSTADDEADS